MDVRVRLWRKLSTEELMLLNCGVGEDSLESLVLQDQSRLFFGRNDAKAGTPVLWPPHVKCWLIGKDSDAWRDWGQEETGMTEDEMAGWHHRLDGRGVWVNSGSWWWTGRPGVLQFMASQRVGHDWATELNWTERRLPCLLCWKRICLQWSRRWFYLWVGKISGRREWLPTPVFWPR